MGTAGDPSSIYTAKEKATHKNLLRARLAGVTKPRRLAAHFFWAQQNKELVKALKEGEEEEEEEKPKKKKKKRSSKKGKSAEGEPADEGVESEEESSRKKSNGVLANYQALCKSEFEKLDKAEQKEWKELAELDLAAKSELYAAVTNGKATTTPQFRQQWVLIPLIDNFTEGKSLLGA